MSSTLRIFTIGFLLFVTAGLGLLAFQMSRPAAYSHPRRCRRIHRP